MAVQDCKEEMIALPLQGRYKAENREDIWHEYSVVMDVKETERSYIFSLVDFKSRYSAAHIEMLFAKSQKVIIKKNSGGHAIRTWDDGSFTLYPFQAGIPFYFESLE